MVTAMKQHFAPLCFALLAATAAPAQNLGDIARLDILPGWRTAEGTHMAAVSITLAPGWKTYWRAPGDAGIPPLFDWTGSENISAASFKWPTPDVFTINGMQSIGYYDRVIIPVELTTGSGPAQMKGQVQLGVCEEVCVPVTLDFNATLPAGGSRDPVIATALFDQPLSARDGAVSAATCTTTPSNDGLRLTTTLTMPSTGSRETVVIEAGDPAVWVSEAVSQRNGNRLTAVADLVQVNGDAFALNRSAVRITVLGSDKAVDIQGCTAG